MRQPIDYFLRYVRFDTTPDEASTGCPSTAGQLVLLEQVADDLRAVGADGVLVDPNGYVVAPLPPTTRRPDVPAIGFLAHVDTSPEVPGADVRPIVHQAYDGRDLVLPDAPGVVLRCDEDPALRVRIGQDIVTASGATLLGADDKAGVAAIMAAACHLLHHPEIARGLVCLAFTSDEEIGRGADRFDVERFGAAYAYTVDGGDVGELEAESFSADAMTLAFSGRNTHPGYAKGRMVNALGMAAAFVDALPRYALTPERSEGDEGYIHAHGVEGSVDRAVVRLLVRDFDAAALREKEALVEGLAREIASRHGGSVEMETREQYRNMREVLDAHPAVVSNAAEAIRRAGLDVRQRRIRGGTDGSRLSFMGLPTANLFAGQHNIHSCLEWTSRQDLDAAARTIVELCRVWEERG